MKPVDHDAFVHRFLSCGDDFENLINDLVRAVGRTCGVDSVDIDWDYRTNVRDGGRDLLIRTPNPRSEKKFLPTRRSVWSLKSGADGVSPTSLRDEVLAVNHPKVTNALKDGWAYVWCAVHPANSDVRGKMREAADKLAETLKIDRSQFEFRWPDQILDELNLFPNVVFAHFPQIALALADVLSLSQWTRELRLTEQWISFGGRNDVVRRVVDHLLGREAPNLLHIAGLSGIGKSRTVYEACRGHWTSP